jgi:membrane-associated protease RseP (regulator of RpoE activity)
MKINALHAGRAAVAGACCATLLALAAPIAGAAEPADRAALEKQLKEARTRLNDAARDVADLSQQLYGGDRHEDLMRFVQGQSQGAMLGINIEDAKGRDDGVEVVGVSPGGPAEQAGLKTGDIVIAMNGQSLRTTEGRDPSTQLVERMRSVEPGQTVNLDYLRDGQKRSATIMAAPAEPPIARILRERLPKQLPEGLQIPGLEGLLGPERQFRSLELVSLTPKLGKYFGTEEGLLVVRAAEGQVLPLEEGDVLLSIDGRTPGSPGHAFRILRSYQPGEKVKLGVLRNRKQLELAATMPEADAAAGSRHRAPLPPAPPAPPAPPSGGIT